jgi:hypothetical protein
MSSKILLDNPSERPGLGFEAYASGLKDIIELSDPQFCIGIFGGWGSGKTTLMRAIERQLNKEFVSVWFNAWRYEKEEHLIIPLLDALRDALVTWANDTTTGSTIDSPVRQEAIRAASTIAKAARAIFAGMAVKVKVSPIEVSLDANRAVAEWRESTIEKDRQDAESPQSPYHASFKALKDSLAEFIQNGKQRIVVFIDDLDRCLPSNALQVLESMKLFFDLEGFVFVVGLDQKIIEASVNWNYRSSDPPDAAAAGPPISGTDYIKKLFQVPFNLPSVSSGQLDDYLNAVFSDAEEGDEGQRDLLACVRPHLDALVGESEVNPREIKRYINSYILQKLIRPDLDDDVTLLLQTIAFRPDWSEAYEVFRSKPDAFTEAAKRQLDGEDSALKDLDPRLDRLPEPFFQYIISKGGHKLLTLDAPQLAEQVRSFETIRSPENPLPERLYRFAQFIESRDPLVLARSPDDIDEVRKEIGSIDAELQDELTRLRYTTPGRERMIDIVSQRISAAKDEADRLGFTVRRGDDMGREDFDNFLNQRSNLVKLIRDALYALQELIESMSGPSPAS